MGKIITTILSAPFQVSKKVTLTLQFQNGFAKCYCQKYFFISFFPSFSKGFNGTGGLLDVFEMHVLNTSGSKGLGVLNKSSGL